MRNLILAVGLLSLCACSSQSSKITVSKTLRGNTVETFDNDDIKSAVKSSCMRLDMLVKGIKETNGLVNVYVSDLDLGTISGAIDKPGFFTPIDDSKDSSGRQVYFLKDDALAQSSVLPADLMSSDAGLLLNAQMTDDCKTVTFGQNGTQRIFDVKAMGHRLLVLQSRDEKIEIRQYIFIGDTLAISVYQPASNIPVCVKGSDLIEKRTFKVAWNQDADFIQIQRRLGALLSDSLNVSNEFRDLVSGKIAQVSSAAVRVVPHTGKRSRAGHTSVGTNMPAPRVSSREIDIDFNTYNYLNGAVQSGQFTRKPVCSSK